MRFVGSRRITRLLPWVSALALLTGVGIFLGARSNTAGAPSASPTGPAAPVRRAERSIAFPPAAWRIAREFLFTAVARKHLAESYMIMDPKARAGYTLKEWQTGTLPNIAFYPIARVLKYNWKNTNYVHPRGALINVIMIAPRSLHVRPLPAQVELAKVGKGTHARWRVSYFATLGGPWVPTYS